MFNVQPLLSDEDTSIALIELDGLNPDGMQRNDRRDTTYELIAGKVIFNISGAGVVLSEPGETVKVRHGTRYTDYGCRAILLATSKTWL